MQIHVFDIASPHPRVQRELYTALELLRVCDQKASLALEMIDDYVTPPNPHRADWDADDLRIDDIDINETQAVCRVNAAILEQIATGVPAISDSAFAALLAFESASHGGDIRRNAFAGAHSQGLGDTVARHPPIHGRPVPLDRYHRVRRHSPHQRAGMILDHRLQHL